MRSSWSLPVFATIATAAFVLAAIIDPGPSAAVMSTSAPAAVKSDGQEVLASAVEAADVDRHDWTTSRVVVYGTAPAVGTPDPGSAQAIAAELVAARGWASSEFDCLYALWAKESGWNVYAHNASSGAYGIPQALPGSKMASAGSDWATNPRTQILWGLSYIEGRYGTPCGAWSHSQRVGWY